ncbi:hypothetical protein I5F52_28090 [Pseudomonas aeruginosa]|uniref:hypothetical protein n=1 Tax=Pseudomonas aeruginosa TaxID=287 RepID=UPI000FD3FF8C|nr:hypothetical protein [Pseudomonas aeruginosa]MBG4555936.1 hypothetical protein [Pseudomonas aeruginosa]MDU0660511.1 hypothetical protein [Pseudomonas aeruginosa]RUJ68306.1 hypothetical protein IPC253_01300 [Pseudomonas aeruginosa]HBP5344313.1 type I toxin-antitoxin system SymE family toxin [Pseudomonas aeruginosa]HBP5522453.1 hypothetical protein [Pseudomonas aeruginosa]
MRRRGNSGAPLGERDDNRLAPRINLRGYWLQRPGFKAKDRTRTRVRQGGLAITAERGEGTPSVGLRRLCDVGDKAVAG